MARFNTQAEVEDALERAEARIAELEKQLATTQEQLDRFMSAHAEALVRIAELERENTRQRSFIDDADFDYVRRIAELEQDVHAAMASEHRMRDERDGLVRDHKRLCEAKTKLDAARAAWADIAPRYIHTLPLKAYRNLSEALN